MAEGNARGGGPERTPARPATDGLPVARALEAEAARGEAGATVQFFLSRRHLADFLRATGEAGLEVVVLKGAALAETAYPRPGLRPFGDLDVLVRPADAPRARAALDALGYLVDEARWADVLAGRECQANFVKDSFTRPVALELHTHLLNNALLSGQIRVDEDGLWRRARPATLAGLPARVLGPEDQLLHLALHLAGHYLAAPRSLRDIAQVCAAREVDWGLLTQIARRARAASACWAALLCGARLLGAAVPERALAALAPRPRRRRDLLARLALARAADLNETATDALRLPLLLLLLDGPLAPPRALARVLLPSRRWLAEHYATEHDTEGGAGPRAAALYGAHARFLTGALARGLRRLLAARLRAR